MRKTHPILVIKYNGVGSYEIDPEATSSCAEQEQARRVRCISALLEHVHLIATV